MAAIQLNQNQLQALIQNAIQGALAAVQQPPPPPPPPPPAVPFALVPGGGDPAVPWNFTNGDGLRLYTAATKEFDPKYDGSPENLQFFLDNIQERADRYGMGGVLTVNIGGGETRSLTTEYGSITEAQMQTHALTYQALDNRNRQSASTLMALIKASLKPAIYEELRQKEDRYTVEVNPGPNAMHRKDGPCMLYQLTMLIAIETRATVSSLLRALSASSLVDLMNECGSDIKEFNKKVNLIQSV
ncbi:MAG: hypothetical protein SGARI_002105 [Bacillariaceae sp.]